MRGEDEGVRERSEGVRGEDVREKVRVCRERSEGVRREDESVRERSWGVRGEE